jgi:hypothetical protein
MSNNGTGRGVFNMLSFWAVSLIGLSLAVAFIWKNAADWMNFIALILASIVVAYYSFFYATRSGQTRKSFAIYLGIWITAVILIVIFLLLPIVNHK